jgi:hypothetical protein
MSKEPSCQDAVAVLTARCEKDGFASAQMSDGQIFMFSLATCRRLLEGGGTGSRQDGPDLLQEGQTLHIGGRTVTGQIETEPQARGLERIDETMHFREFEDADSRRNAMRATPGIEKLKIFARYDGTYDVVAYRKIGSKPIEEKVVVSEVEPIVEKVHGLKAKERRKKEK